MKKIIYPILVLSLLALLSLSAFAVGNDYTFTSPWWNLALSNSTYSFVSSSSTTNGDYQSATSAKLLVNDTAFDSSVIDNSGKDFIFVQNSHSPAQNYIYNFIPMNISLSPNQSITLSGFYINTNRPDKYPVLTGYVADSSGNSISGLLNTYNCSDCEVGEPVYNSQGVTSGWNTLYTGNGIYFEFVFTNNTSSELTYEYICVTLYNSTGINLSNKGYLLGFLSSGNYVNLPPYVEENLINIGNILSESNEALTSIRYHIDLIRQRLVTISNNVLSGNTISSNILDEVKTLSTKLDDLLSQLGVSGNAVTNIYNTLVTPTPEQEASNSELKAKVEQAQAELEEMKKTIDSVIVPTLSDIDSANKDINVTIDEALTSEELTTVLDSIFGQSTVITMLLIVISLATIGYIMYGKRA